MLQGRLIAELAENCSRSLTIDRRQLGSAVARRFARAIIYAVGSFADTLQRQCGMEANYQQSRYERPMVHDAERHA